MDEIFYNYGLHGICRIKYTDKKWHFVFSNAFAKR